LLIITRLGVFQEKITSDFCDQQPIDPIRSIWPLY